MTPAHDSTSLTQAELIAGCLRGDSHARQALYTRTSDRIYRLLLRLTHNPDDAADLLQETYIRVFTHLEGFQGTANLETWIYRIALNEARQSFRRQGRQERLLETEATRPMAISDDGQQTLATRIDVREAVDRLPEEERTLIVLRYFEGLDYARMAEVLEKPAGTIASGLNRARRMLQTQLGDEATENREDMAGRAHPINREHR